MPNATTEFKKRFLSKHNHELDTKSNVERIETYFLTTGFSSFGSRTIYKTEQPHWKWLRSKPVLEKETDCQVIIFYKETLRKAFRPTECLKLLRWVSVRKASFLVDLKDKIFTELACLIPVNKVHVVQSYIFSRFCLCWSSNGEKAVLCLTLDCSTVVVFLLGSNPCVGTLVWLMTCRATWCFGPSRYKRKLYKQTLVRVTTVLSTMSEKLSHNKQHRDFSFLELQSKTVTSRNFCSSVHFLLSQGDKKHSF